MGENSTMKTRAARQTALLAALVLLPAARPAATWYVDASVSGSGDGSACQTAFKTIQEGMDAASDGDTVLVAPCTYFENIHFLGKNIILTSTSQKRKSRPGKRSRAKP